MRGALASRIGAALAVAGSLTGKRFSLLVASSLVATSAVVAGALTGAGGSDALASLLARGLTAHNAPPVTAPSPAPPSGAVSAASHGGSPAAGADPSPRGPVETQGSEAPTSPASPGEESTAPTAQPETGPVKHVFVISLASPGYEAAFGTQSQMPYLATTLRPEGELLNDYTLLGEGSLVNGIAAVSGQPPNAATEAGCPSFSDVLPPVADPKGTVRGTGCVYPVETMTIANQLIPAHLSWRAYVEGMADEAGKPANCVHPDPAAPAAGTTGSYAATQNPFVFFHALLDLGDCEEEDVPLEKLTSDLREAGKKAPSYSFIAPTPCDAGFTSQCESGTVEGAAAADSFLSAWVPKILASPAYKVGGLLVITFSAIDPQVAADTAEEEPLKTGALLVSPFLTPGATDPAPYSPYSLLRSIEDLFGLQPLALAATAKVKSFAGPLLARDGGD